MSKQEKQIVMTYKYKMYRNKSLRHLDRLIDYHCEVYNYCIALHRRYYKMYHKHLSANKLKVHLTKVRKRPNKEHWRELGSQSIQDVAERIERSYKAFFDAKKEQRCGRHSIPHFCKRKNYSSFTLKQTGYKFHDGNHITILGKDYKYVAHRPYEGTIKTVSIKRDNCGDFWLCIVCAKPASEIIPRKGNAIGYDFGLKTFLTGSDGSRIESPRFLEKNATALRSAQQALSRKRKGSANWRRAKMDVARKYQYVRNRRKDWFYKLAADIASQYSDVCIEDLNIKAMQQLWGREISDYAFTEFVSILQNQLSKTGGQLHKVDRFYPSSKTCSHCGHIVEEMPLDVRRWECPICHAMLDRDGNAAVNILVEGMKSA